MIKYIAFIASIILIYLTQPYIVWFNPIAIRTILCIVLGVLFFIYRKKSFIAKETLLFWVYFAAVILHGLVSGNNINYLISTLPIVFIPFASESFFNKVYLFFSKIYAAIIAVSLTVYFIALLGLIHPFAVIPPLNELKLSYDVYPFLVKMSLTPLMRFFGPYDEPGVVGTLSGILLCIERFDFKKWRSVIFLVSGLCSLSLFFYIIVAFNYLIKSSLINKKFQNVVLAAVLLGVFAFVVQNNSELYELIGRRFEWDSEKMSLAGDNRVHNQDAVDYYIASGIDNGDIWFGVQDKNKYLSYVEGSSTIWNSVIIYGVVFVLWYIMFYLMYAYKHIKNRVSYFLFMFVFLGVLYQRPYMMTFLYEFIYIMLAKGGMDTKEELVEINRNR